MTTANPTDARALVAGVREAYEASTQGEWVYNPHYQQIENETNTIGVIGVDHGSDCDKHYDGNDSDGLFIALAHNTMPAILDHLATIESELGDLRTRETALAEFVRELTGYKAGEPPYQDDYQRISDEVREEVAEEAKALLAKLTEGKT